MSRLITLSIIMSIIVLIGLIFSSLALLDIAQNKETDLNLEWMIVRITGTFTIIYVILSIILLAKFKKYVH